jgi:uncharacterized protein
MKRAFSILLIALLLLCPLLTAHADGDDGYIRSDLYLFEQDEYDRLNARAEEIFETRGVAVYFFYQSTLTTSNELIEYTASFADTEVAESDAIILGMNDSHYYLFAKGALGESVFTENAKDALWTAFSAVSGAENKLLAYFDKADELLNEYLNNLAGAATGTVPTVSGKPLLYDSAHLLTDAEAKTLSARLQEITDLYRCDVVIATVASLGNKTAEEFADDFFDYNGYGYGAVPDLTGKTVDGDGILLLLSMEDRDFAVSSSGYGVTAFTDYGIQLYLEAQFLPYFKQNDYNDGFLAYADGCAYLLKAAREGEPFDVFTVTEKTAGGKPVLPDMAGLMDPMRVQELSKKLKEIGDRYLCDVIFVTDTDYRYAGDDAAQRYYTENGYGYRTTVANGSTENRGGILVFYSSYSHALTIHVDGNAQNAFKGRGLYQFRQALLSAMYGGSFEDAVETYAQQSERYLAAAEKGRAINPINVIPIIIAVGAGLLIGFIPVNAMKRQLTDVHGKTSAEEYLTPASFALTMNSDVLLNTSTSRTVHVVESSSGGGSSGRGSGGGGFHGGSSTHTSSSGGTHGGHSGKF